MLVRIQKQFVDKFGGGMLVDLVRSPEVLDFRGLCDMNPYYAHMREQVENKTDLENMAKSSTQRTREMRERRREAGLVRIDKDVSPDDTDLISDLCDLSVRKHMEKSEKGIDAPEIVRIEKDVAHSDASLINGLCDLSLQKYMAKLVQDVDVTGDEEL